MANDKKIIGNKRPRKDECDGDFQKSSGHIDVKKKKKIEHKTDEKLPKTRKSDERQNTRFLGVCLTCYQYGNSTIGEVSDFAYNHMCESSPETIEEDKKKCIEALKKQIHKLESSSTSGTEAKPKAKVQAKPSSPLMPPSSPVPFTSDK